MLEVCQKRADTFLAQVKEAEPFALTLLGAGLADPEGGELSEVVASCAGWNKEQIEALIPDDAQEIFAALDAHARGQVQIGIALGRLLVGGAR